MKFSSVAKSKYHSWYERAFKRKKRFLVFPNYCAMKLTMVLGKHIIVQYPRGINMALEVSLYYPIPTIWQEWFPKHLRPSVRKRPTVARVKFPQFVPRVKSDNNTENLKYIDTSSSASSSSSLLFPKYYRMNSSQIPTTINYNINDINHKTILTSASDANNLLLNTYNDNNDDDDDDSYSDYNDKIKNSKIIDSTNVQMIPDVLQGSSYKLSNNDKFYLKNSNNNWKWHQPHQSTLNRLPVLNVNRNNSRIDVHDNKFDYWNKEKYSNWMKTDFDHNRNNVLLGHRNNAFDRFKNYKNQWNTNSNSKRKWMTKYHPQNYNYYNNKNINNGNRRQNWSLYEESFKNNKNTMTSTFSPFRIQKPKSKSLKFYSFSSSPTSSSSSKAILSALTITSSKPPPYKISDSLDDSIAYDITPYSQFEKKSIKQQQQQEQQQNRKNLNRNWWQWLAIQQYKNHLQQQIQHQNEQNEKKLEQDQFQKRIIRDTQNKNIRPPSVLWSKSDNFNSSNNKNKNNNNKNNNKNSSSSSSSSYRINKSKIIFPATSNIQLNVINNHPDSTLNSYSIDSSTTTKNIIVVLPNNIDNDKTDDDDGDDNNNSDGSSSSSISTLKNHSIKFHGSRIFNTSKNYESQNLTINDNKSTEDDNENVHQNTMENENWNLEKDWLYGDMNEYSMNNNNNDNYFDEIYRPAPKHYNDLEKHKNWKYYRGHRDRRDIYGQLEGLSSLLSISMKSCILRSICEAKRYLLPPGYSLIQDILRILFSFPTKDGLEDDYSEAMKADVYECELKFIKACPISFLDILMHPDLSGK